MSNNTNNKIELNKIKKYLLILLKFLHEICKENNINYSLDCGSLIGAIREKGFIEWDDDADVIFTRDEYEKFINIIKNSKLPEYIGVYYPEEKDHFLDFNVRLFYKLEKVREDDASVNLYDGIFSFATLDLYVLDNIPEKGILNRLYVLKQQILFGLAMSKRHDIKFKKYSLLEKVAIYVLNIIGKLFSIKSICKLHTNCAKSYYNKTNLLYCTSWAPEYPGYQFDKKLFNEYILTDFEDLKLSVVKEYDKVLKIEYGDNYMVPIKTHDHDDFSKNL